MMMIQMALIQDPDDSGASESPEISDEDAQKILDMVGDMQVPKKEETAEPTVEELLKFHDTGLA